MDTHGFVFAVLFLAACGSDRHGGSAWPVGESEGAGAGASRPIDRGDESAPTEVSRVHAERAIEDHCAGAAQRYCAIFACPGNEAWRAQLELLGAHDLASCVVAYNAMGPCELGVAFERGNLQVDADALLECGAIADADACSGAWRDCLDEAARPIGPDGQECFVHSECAGGICHGNFGGVAVCLLENGTCGPRSSVDGRCEWDYQCVDGLGCVEGACAIRQPEGGRCSSSSDCDDDLACIDHDEDTRVGRCAPAAPLGAPCADATPCEIGTYCDDDTARCAPMVAAGELCGAQDACPSFHGCIRGTCQPYALTGEACQLLDVADDCLAWDARCVEGICQIHAGRAGEPCDDHPRCAGWLVCDDGTCVTPATEGEACIDKRCASGRTCGAEGLCIGDWNAPTCRNVGYTPPG